MDDMASEALAGRLLVATPVLADPNFRRTVVLVVEHESDQGTLGVVLNRPTTVPVGQVLEPWTELVTDPSVVFTGGPVAPNSALALAHVPGTGEPVGWHPLDGAPAMTRLGLVDLDAPPGSRSGCTRATRAGAPGSSGRRSTKAPGTSSRPNLPTPSVPNPSACGPRCSAGRAASSPTWRPIPMIQA
jgi:hypothetical protein